MRRSTGLALLPILLLLSGCPGPAPSDQTTDVDRQRADALRAEPILAGATQPPVVQVGRVLNEHIGWDRSSVTATLYSRRPDDAPPVPGPAEFARHITAAVTALRGTGWLVLSAACTPPSPARQASPGPQDDFDWLVYGYREHDGVSQWFRLELKATRQGGAALTIILRAPNHRDPPDLFPDRPAGLPAGSTCVERDPMTTTPVQQGSPIVVSARYTEPANHSADPMSR